MTPLAHQLVKNSLMRPSDRFEVDDAFNILPMITQFHCFEITQVFDLVNEMSKLIDKASSPQDVVKKTLFLPAPKTWLEFEHDGLRQAWAMIQDEDNIQMFLGAGNSRQKAIMYIGAFNITKMMVGPAANIYRKGKKVTDVKELNEHKETCSFFLGVIPVVLAVINSPKIIARNIHKAHKGLAKNLAHSIGRNGRAELHDWHELVLRVATGPYRAESGGDEYVTGKRALHFCRSHLRLWKGEFIHVTGHWRGDAEIGIHQKRYTVKP